MQARIIKGKNYTPPLQPIKKADTTTQVTEQEAFNAGDWIEPPYELAGLHDLVRESTILRSASAPTKTTLQALASASAMLRTSKRAMKPMWNIIAWPRSSSC